MNSTQINTGVALTAQWRDWIGRRLINGDEDVVFRMHLIWDDYRTARRQNDSHRTRGTQLVCSPCQSQGGSRQCGKINRFP